MITESLESVSAGVAISSFSDTPTDHTSSTTAGLKGCKGLDQLSVDGNLLINSLVGGTMRVFIIIFIVGSCHRAYKSYNQFGLSRWHRTISPRLKGWRTTSFFRDCWSNRTTYKRCVHEGVVQSSASVCTQVDRSPSTDHHTSYECACFHLVLQVPFVRNHVLLREMDLSENSLDNIKPISTAWLPMLQKLNLSCNW